MKKGFTLVELLVAMAIIGIILGLAVFGISLAQRGGRDTQRRNAVKDISTGIADLFGKTQNTARYVYITSDRAYALINPSAPLPIPTTYTACNASPTCVAVPLNGPARPDSSGLINGSIGTTANDSSRIWFSSENDGYRLGICLENGSAHNVSTSTVALPSNLCS